MAKRNYSDSEKRNGKKRTNGGRKRIVWTIAGAALLIFIGFGIYIYSGLPSLEELENPRPQLASKVYTVDGELLGQYFIENRIETNIDSLPKELINALISTEDRRFYDHWGVDLSRFAKAQIKNIVTFSREGASTITQQLAKNLYELKSRNEGDFGTVIRKIREWITAIQIEKNFTKNEILELYLNVSYFGRSAYGIESAAKVFFNKKASELTLPESALCVALLKSSENYDPIRQKERALQRRNLVMYNMVDNGVLSQDIYNKLKQQPIILASEKISAVKSIAPHFMEYVRQQMESLSKKYGYDLYRDGLNIYTTLDFRMQRAANTAAAGHLVEYQELFNKNWSWEKNKSLLTSLIDRAIKSTSEYRNATDKEDKAKIYNRLKYSKAFIDSVKEAEQKIQVGFVVLEPSTGEIRAMVGGENQSFGRGLNHVTGIRRQPGSSFKPIVYTVAIDNGYSPAYTLLNQKFNHRGWTPNNANNEYGGYMTLREGLTNSVNVISGRLTIGDMAPPNQVVKYAKRLGINSELSPYPSIALGTSEVTPLELTSAFGTLANKGVHVAPIAILKIEDRNGIIIDQFIPEYTEAISPETASIMTDMLQDVVSSGTGAGVRRYFHRPAAGKTGTTQNFSDAWFVGYTPQLVGGVWVGFDDHRVKFTNWYGQGAKAALPIWAKFMEAAYKEIEIPLEYFELASGVTSAVFCKETLNLGDARIASVNCPSTVIDIVDSKHMPAECELHTGTRIRQEDNHGDTGW
ncbi:MAG: PBP1A family penicillin-binding protein [Ignavibacteriaceae bacterium]